MNTPEIYIGKQCVRFLTEHELFTHNSNESCLIYKSTKSDERMLFFDILVRNPALKELRIVSNNPTREFKRFCSLFKNILAAGGLIQKENSHEFLMIYRWDKWDLPKGKLEKGELPRNAAIRECIEECNINGLKIFKTLEPTYHMYILKDKWVLKKTYWYFMKSSYKGKLTPQQEEGITKVQWIKLSQFNKVMKQTYPTIQIVMKNVL
jgi:8-oxo-dGTP pyrophosphatase MutT (NUDIX family)